MRRTTTRAVVIGSGPNGLAAAIRLAEQGWQVTLLEAAEALGGAVRSAELTLPGFIHDPFSSVYPQGAGSPAFTRLPLARYGLRWSQPDACLAHVLDGGEALLLERDLAATVRQLDAQHPGDGARWAAFVEPFLAAFPQLRDAMLTGFPPVASGLALARAVPPRALAALVESMTRTGTAFARSMFRGEMARGWFYGMAGHSATPPERGSALVAVTLGIFGHAVGWPSPVGGAGRLTDALAAYFHDLGGSSHVGAEAIAIDVRQGAVYAVRVEGRDAIPCDVVVADVLPAALLRLAGEALPSRYRRSLGRYELGPATFKIDWALDGVIPWEAPGARRAGTVHVAGDGAEMARRLGESRQRLAQDPYLVVGQQSIFDPSRAPAGCHTAWAYMHGPRDAPWAVLKADIVRRIEGQIERFAPGFAGSILDRHVTDPQSLERSNQNLPGGDLGGGAYHLRQLLFRPVIGASPYRAPVRGLYLGSAATFPGGGVHGACGDAAARCAIADAEGGLPAIAGRVAAHAFL